MQGTNEWTRRRELWFVDTPFALRWQTYAFLDLCKSFCAHQKNCSRVEWHICLFIWKTAALSMSYHVDITSYWDHTRMLNSKKCHHHLHHHQLEYCVLSLSLPHSFAPSPTFNNILFSQTKICKTFWQTDNQLIVIFCRFVLENFFGCRLFMIQMTYSTF